MALTSTYTTISSAQTDADSPLDTILMEALRQNDNVLYEWMGGPTYTPSTSHNHDGSNSRPITGTALAMLSTGSMIGSSSLVFSTVFMSTLYDNYHIRITSAHGSAGASLMFQYYTTGGALSSAVTYTYGYHIMEHTGPNSTYLASGGDVGAKITKPLSTAEASDGHIDVYAVAVTKAHRASVMFAGMDSSNAPFSLYGTLRDSSTTARGGFQLKWSDGAGGNAKVRIYGLRNSPA